MMTVELEKMQRTQTAHMIGWRIQLMICSVTHLLLIGEKNIC